MTAMLILLIVANQLKIRGLGGIVMKIDQLVQKMKDSHTGRKVG
jgi:hypothetical protein